MPGTMTNPQRPQGSRKNSGPKWQPQKNPKPQPNPPKRSQPNRHHPQSPHARCSQPDRREHWWSQEKTKTLRNITQSRSETPSTKHSGTPQPLATSSSLKFPSAAKTTWSSGPATTVEHQKFRPTANQLCKQSTSWTPWRQPSKQQRHGPK